MPAESEESALRARLQSVLERGEVLESEGVPFPTDEIRSSVEDALAAGQDATADSTLRRAEALCERASVDWSWLKPLLARVADLRDLAAAVGLDLGALDTRLGDPEVRLRAQPVTTGSLERVAAAAALMLAALEEALPKFCLEQAQTLGEALRDARNRGRDVGAATGLLSRFLRAARHDETAEAARLLVELRAEVERCTAPPRARPGALDEESEILEEARRLARRIQELSEGSDDATRAERLASQVRAALGEASVFGTPQEEAEALWREVDRLAKEREDVRTRSPTHEGSEERDAQSPAAVERLGRDAGPERSRRSAKAELRDSDPRRERAAPRTPA